MRFSILLFCLLCYFFSQGNTSSVCALVDDQRCSASDLKLPEVDSLAENDLHYIPFTPRKFKSKSREVLEIPNGLIDWCPHFFSSTESLFVHSSVLLNDCDNLFQRGPPPRKQSGSHYGVESCTG
jgi:hypothetical protein